MTLLHDRSLISDITTRARAAVGFLTAAERAVEAAQIDVNQARAAAQVATDAMTELVAELDAAQAEQRELLSASVVGEPSAAFGVAFTKITSRIALVDARLAAAAHARMVAEMASQSANKAFTHASDRVLRGQAAADAADPKQFGLPDPPTDEDDAEELDRELDLELGFEQSPI